MTEPRPNYASEQDLPSEPHPPVEGYDANGNPINSSKIAFPTSDLESESGAGAGGAGGEGELGTDGKPKKKGKPLLDTLLKKNAQWRYVLFLASSIDFVPPSRLLARVVSNKTRSKEISTESSNVDGLPSFLSVPIGQQSRRLLRRPILLQDLCSPASSQSPLARML
jgi:hypothetical protein